MVIGLLALGLAAGVLSGLFGIGGGIVMVPALIAIFGFDILDANAISLAAMLLPVSILGVIAYYKAGYVDFRKSLFISLGLLAGSFFGAKIALNIGEGLLAKMYAGLLLYVAVSYLDIPSLIKKNRINSETAIAPRGSVWAFILLGIFAGVIAGMFGKGGGLIIVPALVTIFRFDSKTAAATSLTALQLPVGLPSVIIYAQQGHLNIRYAAFIAGGILFGAFVGTKIAIKTPSALFKKIYAIFLFAVTAYLLYRYL